MVVLLVVAKPALVTNSRHVITCMQASRTVRDKEKKMTTAGLEPATFWCRRRSKPNALPLRQVALLVNDPALYMSIMFSIDKPC